MPDPDVAGFHVHATSIYDAEQNTLSHRLQTELKKKQAETEALIKGLMSMIPASLPTR